MEDDFGAQPALEAIIECGAEAGLTACGVTDCAPSDHGAWLDAWIAAGAHASMEWMARTAAIRKELTLKWDWARSALVGALSYGSDAPPPRGLARHVSRYARGRDYHEVLRERLAAWCEALAERTGGPFRHALLVDTSAILERELAVRAGLGWIGKNTCLIGPDGDSWRFIGVVLTAWPLPRRARPAPERCGSCTACLDACPTGALPEPRFLDSRRCISYLTIEHRGPIEGGLHASMGEWAFGCDICQEVCPWNHRPTAAPDPGLAADPALEQISLAELAALDDESFRRRFRRTPLARPKRSGMVRNALIAGANCGDRDVLGLAETLVEDPDPAVAETARAVLLRDRG